MAGSVLSTAQQDNYFNYLMRSVGYHLDREAYAFPGEPEVSFVLAFGDLQKALLALHGLNASASLLTQANIKHLLAIQAGMKKLTAERFMQSPLIAEILEKAINQFRAQLLNACGSEDYIGLDAAIATYQARSVSSQTRVSVAWAGVALLAALLLVVGPICAIPKREECPAYAVVSLLGGLLVAAVAGAAVYTWHQHEQGKALLAQFKSAVGVADSENDMGDLVRAYHFSSECVALLTTRSAKLAAQPSAAISTDGVQTDLVEVDPLAAARRQADMIYADLKDGEAPRKPPTVTQNLRKGGWVGGSAEGNVLGGSEEAGDFALPLHRPAPLRSSPRVPASKRGAVAGAFFGANEAKNYDDFTHGNG